MYLVSRERSWMMARVSGSQPWTISRVFIGAAKRVHVEETARPWVAKPGHPRRAAVSSFGFGGSNFHAVLEENQSSRSEADWLGVSDLIAFSADD